MLLNFCSKNLFSLSKKLFLLLLVLLVFDASAQKSRVKNLPKYDARVLHFGFALGLDNFDFTIRNSDDFFIKDANGNYIIDRIYGIENQTTNGFHIGPISNLRINKYFDVRFLILLTFGQRDLNYKIAQDPRTEEEPFRIHTMKIESTFVEFPLLLKFKSKRLNNFRPYLIGGINPKLDLAAQKEIDDEEKPKIRLHDFDVYWEIGFGIDFYLMYFKFSTELKFSVGLRNVLVYDDTQFTDAIQRMSSKMFVLSFNFE